MTASGSFHAKGAQTRGLGWKADLVTRAIRRSLPKPCVYRVFAPDACASENPGGTTAA
jgi:hypothetical protein